MKIKDVAIGLVCQMDESAVLPARGERPSRPRLVAPTAPFAPTQLRAPPQQLGGWWRPPHGPRAVCGAVCPCAPQVFLLQLGWLALSLTDPLDAPGQNPARRRPSARPADAPPSGRPCGCGAVYRAALWPCLMRPGSCGESPPGPVRQVLNAALTSGGEMVDKMEAPLLPPRAPPPRHACVPPPTLN